MTQVRRSSKWNIRTAHAPNATMRWWDVVAASLSRRSVSAIEDQIGRDLNVEHAVLFASARGALAAVFEVIASRGTVAVPGFTCVAVPNAVVAARAEPIFVEVTEAGLVNPTEWPDCDVVMIQDTFGFESAIPPDAVVVRDASHSGKTVAKPGSFASVTSFEQSKWFSCGRGGLVATSDDVLAASLRQLRAGYPPSNRSIVPLSAVTMAAGALAYRGARIASNVVFRLVPSSHLAGQSSAELSGKGIDPTTRGIPRRSLAALMSRQVHRAESIKRHRVTIVSAYDDMLGITRTPEPLLRYPMIADDPDRCEAYFRRHGWDIRGRWFKTPVHPIDPGVIGLDTSSIPVANKLSRTVINLPTHPRVSIEDARQLATLALSVNAKAVIR